MVRKIPIKTQGLYGLYFNYYNLINLKSTNGLAISKREQSLVDTSK